ncbi:putative glycerol-3-phosphate acyltransferase [Candidatus Nitrotoga sp. HW29]|uniref:glycerol-3-phosphate 1-O-acyltransferase PlsY n=1 Tax=Candidatus Nitrotoga sp. HW29 TaxID=2886963 RepID=UPI001EF2BC48|nr:glycerol-3-phosphate 1-O-acyltransferase PlsY [Candidatus Nitrotoga sp. HW29]CAH1904453.1 putative glycerol-3-phosphate acyltransferase [Candidatus Nitrotoga sp. HW29]
MKILSFIVCAYLLGSVSFAVIMSRLFVLPDPRTYGSHNPGATNVLRSGNRWAAILTLLGDAAKGWLAVWVAQHFEPQDGNSLLVAAVALAVFLGHLFPIFLHFKGGKGVATALGILLALNVWLGLAVLTTWILVALVFRLSSLAALLAAVGAPVYAMALALPPEYIFTLVGISLLLFWRHKSNIQNLLAGTESRIAKKKDSHSE